jgi:hypothetical protein
VNVERFNSRKPDVCFEAAGELANLGYALYCQLNYNLSGIARRQIVLIVVVFVKQILNEILPHCFVHLHTGLVCSPMQLTLVDFMLSRRSSQWF